MDGFFCTLINVNHNKQEAKISQGVFRIISVKITYVECPYMQVKASVHIRKLKGNIWKWEMKITKY